MRAWPLGENCGFLFSGRAEDTDGAVAVGNTKPALRPVSELQGFLIRAHRV
jgi:hypothetical protein